MPLYLRENDAWKEIVNTAPDSITGYFTHYTDRVHNTTYTNNSGTLIHVSATIGLDRGTSGVLDGVTTINSISTTDVAGSSARAFVVSPSNVTTEVSNIRDNGSANTEYSFYNCRFFVPLGYGYYIRVYNSDDKQWTSGPLTYTWSELSFAAL